LWSQLRKPTSDAVRRRADGHAATTADELEVTVARYLGAARAKARSLTFFQEPRNAARAGFEGASLRVGRIHRVL
jgi:hypothetical protein